MIIRFIDIYSGHHDEITSAEDMLEFIQANNDDNNSRFLYRRNGYFYNKDTIKYFQVEDIFGDGEIIVYTDDEQMLNYAEYSDELHNFKVEILFNRVEHLPTKEDFIPLNKIYPNIRKVNNLAKMYMSGTILHSYSEMLNKER